MKCRCGHGREKHGYTAKGLKYARQQRARGRVYVAKQPCHGWNTETYSYAISEITINRVTGPATVSGTKIVPCKCRDWHPVEAS